MGWKLGDMPHRTPGERCAYIAGYSAGVGQAVEYTDQGKPLDKLLDLAALMQEGADADANQDR